MARVKIVKCYLRSPGEAPTLRFVQLREYFLWKYYMTHRHGKIVEGEEISLWIDADTYGAAPPRQARPLEPVVRVDLHYWDPQKQTSLLAQRYFPLEEYDRIRDVFLRHYPEAFDEKGRALTRRQLSETRGYFVHSQIPPLPNG